MLYDENFINSLPELKKGWKNPILLYVVNELSTEHKNIKNLIEKWYSKINEDKKAEYASRLKSLDDKIFISQLFEILVFEHCEKLFPLELDPKLDNGKTPEMIWNVNDEKVILDVLTLFDDEVDFKKGKALDELIDYLSEDVSDYNYGISLINIDHSKLKKKKIKKELLQHAESGEEYVEFEIEDYGFEGKIEIIAKREPGKTHFFTQSNAREIEPLKSIEKRIKSKVSKYKWDGALIVAICKHADFGADIDDVKEILYGSISYFVNPESNTTYERLNPTGLYTKQIDGKLQFTSLTGVLYCELVWDEQPNIRVTYLENPNTKYKLNIEG